MGTEATFGSHCGNATQIFPLLSKVSPHGSADGTVAATRLGLACAAECAFTSNTHAIAMLVIRDNIERRMRAVVPGLVTDENKDIGTRKGLPL